MQSVYSLINSVTGFEGPGYVGLLWSRSPKTETLNIHGGSLGLIGVTGLVMAVAGDTK